MLERHRAEMHSNSGWDSEIRNPAAATIRCVRLCEEQFTEELLLPSSPEIETIVIDDSEEDDEVVVVASVPAIVPCHEATISRQHQTTWRWYCSINLCGRHFATKDDLRRHVFIRHAGGIYVCWFTNCLFQTRDRLALGRHLVTQHSSYAECRIKSLADNWQ